MKRQPKRKSKKLVCPKAGTATSSPDVLTTSSTILNVMFWMKKEAYADSTIKATAKRLKHQLLQQHFKPRVHVS